MSTPTDAPATDEASTVCPNVHGGACLGALEPGRYRTTVFTPALAYVALRGWANMEDLPGNFLLLPPGRDLDGVDAGTVDYLGIYSGVTVAAADCQTEAAPGVGLNPERIVEALARRDGLHVSEPERVEVGGHRGFVIDVQLTPGTQAGCEVEEAMTIIPLFIGAGPAEVEHAQVSGVSTRLYVLENGESNVLVEVSDVHADRGPFRYGRVVRSLRIGR